MKTYKIITKIVLPLALVGTLLVSCRDKNELWHKEGDFRGYHAKAGVMELGKQVTVYDKENLNAMLVGRDEDNDGTIDKIIFRNIDPNSSLNKYANRDSLEVAYSEITGKYR